MSQLLIRADRASAERAYFVTKRLTIVGSENVHDVTVAGGPAGIVNFLIKDDRVRFDIDDEMAARNGIYINASLLGLAVNVKRRPADEAH